MKNLLKQEQTIAVIEQTFLELIERKPLEEIRVSDICRICGISRPTFYTYYQDVIVLNDIVEDNVIEDCMRDFHAYGLLLKDPERFFNEFNRCFKGKSGILNALARGRQDEQDLKIINMLVKAGSRTGNAAEQVCLTVLVSGLFTIVKQYRASSTDLQKALGQLRDVRIDIAVSHSFKASKTNEGLSNNGGTLNPYKLLNSVTRGA